MTVTNTYTGAYVTNAPRRVAFFGCRRDLVRLAVDACRVDAQVDHWWGDATRRMGLISKQRLTLLEEIMRT